MWSTTQMSGSSSCRPELGEHATLTSGAFWQKNYLFFLTRTACCHSDRRATPPHPTADVVDHPEGTPTPTMQDQQKGYQLLLTSASIPSVVKPAPLCIPYCWFWRFLSTWKKSVILCVVCSEIWIILQTNSHKWSEFLCLHESFPLSKQCIFYPPPPLFSTYMGFTLRLFMSLH